MLGFILLPVPPTTTPKVHRLFQPSAQRLPLPFPLPPIHISSMIGPHLHKRILQELAWFIMLVLFIQKVPASILLGDYIIRKYIVKRLRDRKVWSINKSRKAV